MGNLTTFTNNSNVTGEEIRREESQLLRLFAFLRKVQGKVKSSSNTSYHILLYFRFITNSGKRILCPSLRYLPLSKLQFQE